MISVVVPTLGKCDLNILIRKINSSTLKPKEILICIPKKYKNNLNSNYDENVKIIYTRYKGQVIQRIYGFKNCTCNYVLQLDDDVILDENAIKCMYDKLIDLGANNVVGPLYFDKNNNYLHRQKSQYKQIIEDIYTYLMDATDWNFQENGDIILDVVTIFFPEGTGNQMNGNWETSDGDIQITFDELSFSTIDGVDYTETYFNDIYFQYEIRGQTMTLIAGDTAVVFQKK